MKFVAKENFEGMKGLKSLWLDGNEISEIPIDVFLYVRNLEELSLSSNKLKSLDNNLLVRLPSLKVFRANFNELQEINDFLFDRNEMIKEISFRKNKLMRVSMKFEDFDELKRIDLRSNICIDACAKEKVVSDNNCNLKVKELEEEIEKMC